MVTDIRTLDSGGGAPATAARAMAPGTVRAGEFRDDIGGLRAIAATIVTLFHFGVKPFGGGFVGVDVFFVISGLLMTQIIDRGIARGGFSVFGFYAARFRRIVPALAVLCALLLPFGALCLDPLTLGEVAHDAVASLLFYSNMLYAAQSGYFAEASDANWLLHTWTLSVEWQFYIVYPVVLWLAARWAALWRRRTLLVGAACVLAFVGTMLVAGHAASFQQYAFFLLPTRAWEMLAGGWLALARPQIRSEAVSKALAAGGLVAILGSALLLDATLPWPSLWMVFPIAGTVAVLAAARSSAAWARLPGVQAFGRWSYSLYLCHWPIIAGLHYYGVAMTPAVIAAGLVATLLAAIASYELVETRLRKALFPVVPTPPRRWLAIGALCALLVAATATAMVSHGFARVRLARLDAPTRARLADYAAAPGDWLGMAPCGGGTRLGTGRTCVLGRGHPRRVAIIGDSHAEQMLPRLALLARDNPVEITLARQQGCPPLPHLLWTASGRECARFADTAFDTIERGHYPRVLILAAWTLYFGNPGGVTPGALCAFSWRGCRPLVEARDADAAIDTAFAAFAQRLHRLVAGGAVVTVVLPGPVPDGAQPRDYYRRTFFAHAPVIAPSIDRAAYLARTARIRALLIAAAAQAGAKVLDPVAARCGPASCPVFDGGAYLFKDKHHLRASIVTRPGFAYLDAAIAG